MFFVTDKKVTHANN